MSPETFKAIVSGERRGIVAGLLRGLLRIAAGPYSLAVNWRNRRFDRQSREIVSVGVPVISVGNITLGGTGKTPCVAWLARWFTERGVRVVLISRGYGAKAGQPNDEALELARLLPNVPHVQYRDRVAAAKLAIERHGAQLLLLDDAFQHRRIARDLDLVLLDALEPFGYGHVFPGGLLREPLAGLARAQVIGISRADLVSETRRAAIRQQAACYAPQAKWLELAHRPARLISPDGSHISIADLAGKEVAAFCGIGNPEGFRRTLQNCEFKVKELRAFPDHHAYTLADQQSLAEWVKETNANAIICTLKDFVKLDANLFHGLPIFALEIGMEILSGSADFERMLEPLIPKPA